MGRVFEELGLALDWDDIKRAYIHDGALGESISFKRKAEDDIEAILLESPEELFSYLQEINDKIGESRKSSESIKAQAETAYATAFQRAESDWKKKYADAVSAYRARCDAEVRKAYADRDEAISAKEKAERQNSNLMRIQRERANARRGLKPKKQRSGYVLLDTGHASYKYTYKEPRTFYRKGKRQETDETLEKTGSYGCYRSVYETPVNALLDEGSAFEAIYGNWMAGLWGDAKRPSLWINFAKKGSVEKNGSGQLIFDWAMKPDMGSGLWHITIWHHEPLSPMPENLNAKRL